MRLALASELPRAIRWRASIANNMGSSERERGNLDAAARHFDAALAHQATGTPLQVRIAWWQVANVNACGANSMTRFLPSSSGLSRKCLAAKEPDEYVYEELVAISRTLKRPEDTDRYTEKLNGFEAETS